MPYCDLFPIRIYKNKIENCENIYKDLKPFLSNLYKELPDEGYNFETTFVNECVYHGETIKGNQLYKLDLFQNLVNIVNPMIKEYWQELNIVESMQPKIFEMWSNRLQSNSTLNMHNHVPAVINGLIYLNKDKDHGNLVFENPNSLLASMMPVDFYNNKQIAFGIEHEIEVSTGDVLIFPGWLKHRVTKTTKDERIILGFNCIGEGQHPSTVG